MESSGDSQSPSSEKAVRAPDAQPVYTRTSCDLCKKMKIKCEREGETCVHCNQRGLKCEMTLVKRKKQSKRESPLVDVESRIRRLESVLTASGLDVSFRDEYSATEIAGAGPDLSDKLSTLVVTEGGNSRYLGASSGLSLFSPQGLQWISEKVGGDEVSQLIATLAQSKLGALPSSKETHFHPLAPHEREPFPPKEIADQLVDSCFENFYSVFPIYDRAIFNEYYELQYAGNPRGGVAWYATLNLVLCMGNLLLRDESLIPDNRADSLYRNACSCYVDLVFKDYSLMTVQALCAMAFIQHARLDPQPVYMLVAAAARIAHAIGLHRKLDDFGLSRQELDQRRNVFWIVFIIEKAVALRLGHSSVIVDDDIGVDLPPENHEIPIYPDGSKIFDLFRCHVQLAQIEGRIYLELYSVRARKRPEFERLNAVGLLDKALQEWREALPIEVRPGEPIACAEIQWIPVLMINFSYLNCVTTLHRVTNHGSWTSTRSMQDKPILDSQRLNPRVYASHSICLMAARGAIKLLQEVKQKEVAARDHLIWMALYTPLSGFLTLFANILQHPQDSNVESDLELMHSVTEFLNAPSTRLSPLAALIHAKIFKELRKVAIRFIEKTNSTGMKAIKRAREDDPISDELHSYDDDTGGAKLMVDVDMTNHIPAPQDNTQYLEKLQRSNIYDLGSLNVQSTDAAGNRQHQQQLLSVFGSVIGNGMNVPMPDQSPPSFNGVDMAVPNMFPDTGFFSESFEWDLANIWTTDFTGFMQEQHGQL